MLPSCRDSCMRASTVHLLSSTACYRGCKVTDVCVGICTAEAERARWERNTWHISSQLIQPVHVIDSVSERVHVHMCVWIEDDPPTLSHIGSGTLAVRGAHLLKTGLIHCLRGRITGKRVTLHIRPCLGEVSQSACMCVPLKDHISDCKSTIGSILAITVCDQPVILCIKAKQQLKNWMMMAKAIQTVVLHNGIVPRRHGV